MDETIKKDNKSSKEENKKINDIDYLTEKEKDKENLENKVKEIIEKNPLDELKLIKEKIRKENQKIDEIDSKIDRIKNNRKIIKREHNLNFNY